MYLGKDLKARSDWIRWALNPVSPNERRVGKGTHPEGGVKMDADADLGEMHLQAAVVKHCLWPSGARDAGGMDSKRFAEEPTLLTS